MGLIRNVPQSSLLRRKSPNTNVTLTGILTFWKTRYRLVLISSPKVSRQMELLLNLFWLLLAMPAFWLWHYSRSAPQRRALDALQCFLALGCLLVILFPVVSASDDLRTMRAVMEESSSKKSICQAVGDKQSSLKWQAQHAGLASASASCGLSELAWHRIPASVSSSSSARVIARSERAPPGFVLA